MTQLGVVWHPSRRTLLLEFASFLVAALKPTNQQTTNQQTNKPPTHPLPCHAQPWLLPRACHVLLGSKGVKPALNRRHNTCHVGSGVVWMCGCARGVKEGLAGSPVEACDMCVTSINQQPPTHPPAQPIKPPTHPPTQPNQQSTQPSLPPFSSLSPTCAHFRVCLADCCCHARIVGQQLQVTPRHINQRTNQALSRPLHNGVKLTHVITRVVVLHASQDVGVQASDAYCTETTWVQVQSKLRL